MTLGPDPRTVANTVTGPAGNVVQAGTIEGGIHHYYGTRRHVIEEFRAPGPPDAAWLMDQPSRLLDARSQVVPFTGRDTELRQLRQWRDSTDTRLSVLLLHAPGGQGKTRLAAEFAERSPRWHVLQAGFHGTATPGTGAAQGDAAGVLLIVDYADRWAHGELERLLADPVLHQRLPTRILMIGRTVRWYAAIRGELADRQAATDDLPLPPLATDRFTMFAAARDRYGQPDLYDLPDTTGIEPPGSLEHADLGLTLTLHMAALVAVDARKRGRRPPTDPHELSAYLLDREYRAWQRLYDAASHGQDYRTRPAVMARTVFTAALTGAVGHDTGTQALRTLDLPGHPQDLLLDHRFCYPPADRDLVLEPLYPDRLAEDFLALLTPGHHVSAYDPDPWANTVPATLLATGDLRRAVVNRAVTFLASAAGRWPHLADKVLYPLLRNDPGLALEAGSGALTALAAIDDIPFDVLVDVYEILPAGRHIDLDVGAAAICGVLTTTMLRTTTDPAVKAELHIDYSNRLSDAGRRDEGVEHSALAVEHYRELVARDGETHLHDLARAVNNHASGMAQLGRRDEALRYAQQAVDLRERLAAGDRHAHLSDLAKSVHNHANRLAEAGQRAEALEYSGRAVDLYEELAASDRAAHLPGLAGAVDSHASRLAEVGRRGEALEYSGRAVEYYGELTTSDGQTHLPDLARAFDHHSWWLAESDRRAEALEYSRQAVEIREELTRVNRLAYLADLAASVGNYANRLVESGMRDAALEHSGRAVELSEELAASDRIAHLPRLAMQVSNHAVWLADVGRRDEALRWSRRAVELREELVAQHRAAHLHDLAASTHNHAKTLAAAGRGDEALEYSRRAVELREELAAQHRAAHLHDLMASTHNHAVRLSLAERHDEAERYSRRAMELREELAGEHRDAHLPDLAASDDAADPAAYAPGRARQLNDHVNELAWAGREAEALELSRRTVEHYRRSAEADPDTYVPDLAMGLSGFAWIRVKVGTDLNDALPAAGEALHAYRRLAAHEPELFIDDLLDTANTLAEVLRALGRADEAEQVHRDIADEFGGS